jgi:hypothetical protein
MNERLRVEAAFFAALDKAEPAERAACLEETCAGNKTLRHRVEDLLAAVPQVGQFLERPIAEAEGLAALGTGENAGPELSFLGPPSAPGSLGRLDQFEVFEVIGHGGTGVVLRARDTKLERIVALKVLAAPLAVSGTARQRFAREARAAAAVRDEHVVAIHAVHDEAPVPYLVMEFIDGCNLETHLRRPLPSAPSAREEGRARGHGAPLEVQEVLRIGLQIASGLAAAHRQGLIHRDIKPANILLENGVQRVKLTDFGLARAADDANLTQTGFIAGTPLYMAPEQAAGEPMDARTDLFSLGSVPYELCAGYPTFRAPSTVAVIRRICDETPRPLREISPDVPEGLCRLIEQLHAKKPADRPASAQEVADQLAQLLADHSAGHVSNVRGWQARSKRAPQKWLYAAAALVLLCAGLGLSEATGLTDVDGTIARLLSPEGTPVVEADDPAVTVALDGGESEPVRDDSHGPDPWELSVAELPPAEQVEAVERRLRELNPEFRGNVESKIKDGKVQWLKFDTDQVTDISPVRALQGLKSLDCAGNAPRQGRVSDLAPLRGLPLQRLNCSESQVANLEPLRGMSLEILHCHNTGVSSLTPLEGMQLSFLTLQESCVTDLKPLRGMPLKGLDMASVRGVTDLKPLEDMPLTYLNLTDMLVSDLSVLASLKSLERLVLDRLPVSDLGPLRGLPLTVLSFPGTRVTDLTPLVRLPLERVVLDYRPEDERILRSLAGLTMINNDPAAQFWKEMESK